MRQRHVAFWRAHIDQICDDLVLLTFFHGKHVERLQRDKKKKLIKKTFDTIDADGSGHIDFEEFKEACGSDDDAAVRKLFDLLDEDGGGTIEKEELVHALKNNEEASKLAEQFPHLKAMFDAEEVAKREKAERFGSRGKKESSASNYD
mgnify:CR=1 FL=1